MKQHHIMMGLIIFPMTQANSSYASYWLITVYHQIHKRHLYYNCEKCPLSPLKLRGLALHSWHVPYNWCSGSSMHQSFKSFLSLNWRFFHDTYLTIEVQGVRCTNHLNHSCPLTDVNPHFTAPGCRYYFKIDGLLWRHRHMGQTLAIVTSQWPIVPTGIYGRMKLSSARVKGIAITCEAMNCLAHDFIILQYRGRMIHCSLRHTGRPYNLYTFWVKNDKFISYTSWFNIFVYLPLPFRTPVFQHGASLVNYNCDRPGYLVLMNQGCANLTTRCVYLNYT